MNEKDDVTLSMDETANPDLVDKPTIDHELKAEPEAEVETEAEEKAEQPRGPDGKFASKEKGEEPPTGDTATPAENPIPDDQFKGYLTEKRKRQELEQEVAALRQQFAQPKPQEQPPAFWDDPDKAIDTRIQGAVHQAIAAFQQQQTAERLNASEDAAKGKYADYGDAFAAFQQAAQADPSLIQRMTRASDPAEFAYSKGKTALELQKVGSIDELLAQKRAEWEAEVKAAAPRPSFPSSTVNDGSVASRGGPIWGGPVQDKDILPMG